MRTFGVIIVALTVVCAAAERKWQTGTCMDVGTKRDARVGAGAADSGPFVRSGVSKGTLPEVATFVIETESVRIEAQELQPIGPGSLNFKAGDPVSFAVDKKTLYVRDANGAEHRLLVTKNANKPKS
ncbi:MAG TPA: hypothetical protein VKH42_07230 [Vicinamibacterales bacterium]|nr:hypothetical protein [Vicinamibacterales bacterium]